MALKTMIFIDGSWMFHNKQHIVEALDDNDTDIDYRKIPEIIRMHLENTLDIEVDIVRTHYFASIPVNRPGFDATKQESFYKYLSEKCFFETEVYGIDFRNDPNCRPREKCVDIALASSMLYFAAIANSYDIAALVAGDLDYLPLIQRVRSLGKRTLLVGLNSLNNYSSTSSKLLTEPMLFDYPPIFLEDYIEELCLKREQVLRRCMNCNKKEFTTWTGKDFYCSKCRAGNTKRIRICDNCDKEEATTWVGPSFYCEECRGRHRKENLN